ncbi:MAG: hypothetical protein KDA89_24555, partial [Planctomycetaceae bacterium]|nr:hypothetical protein [Planctomycetaceae bacterium]
YHDKIRETVLSELPVKERRNLHAKFAEWLLQQSPVDSDAVITVDRADAHPRVFDLAFHLLESGDDRAFAFQLAAGERAVEECALDTAEGYLRAAARLLPKRTEDRTQFRLLFSQAETQRGLGHLQQAIDAYQQALPLAAKSTEAARCEYGIGLGMLQLGKMDRARQHLARALAHVGERIPLTRLQRAVSLPRVMTECYLLPSSVLRLYRRRGRTDEENAVAMSILGTSHYVFMTSYFDMAGILARGSILGKLSSDPGDQVLAVVGQSNNYTGAGFFRIARRMLRGVEPRIRRIKAPLQNAIIQHNMGVTYFLIGDLIDSETRLVNSLPVLQRVRHYYVGLNLHWLRHIESVRGDAQAIEKWARQELEWGEATGDSMTIAYGQYGLADALSRQGDCETAIHLATEAVDRLERINFATVTIARQELGRALLQASDYAAAAEVLSLNARAVFWGCMTFEIRLDTFSLRVEALAGPCFAQGPSEFSSAQLRSINRAARAARWLCGHFPTLRPHACRVSGRAACTAGRFGKAQKYFDEAIRSAEHVGARSELARTLIDKSWLDHPDAAADRNRGFALLRELHCVLPEAEVEALEAQPK